MTLAKKTFYLASSLLLAGAMGAAQSGQSSTPSVGSQDQDSSMAGQAAGAVLRGCLSGSDGNYTLTDHNGAIYHLIGASSQLQNAVGHEVQVTGAPDARRTGATDDTATNTASSFQVTGMNDMASTCDHRGSRSGTMSGTPRNPDTDSHPKGAPGEGAPPQPQTEPGPHLMALLQQPASGGTMPQGNTSDSSVGTPSTINSQDAQSVGATGAGQTTSPPVTSQTTATPQSPTDPNAQMGTGTANPTGRGAAAGTNPAEQTGTTAVPPASTTPNAPATTTTPEASGTSVSTTGTNATTGTSASPTAPQNDQNKPLYERQATDVPWANHSGTNNSTTTTTTPEPRL